jgi:hypothetical protein
MNSTKVILDLMEISINNPSILDYFDQEVKDLIYNTKKWIDILNSNVTTGFPKGWDGLKEVQLAHVHILNNLVKKEYKPPQYSKERGIVIGAGGAKYFGCGFACFHTLRSLGCKLPVEFWYLDDYEMDNNMKSLCDAFGIRYVNAREFCEKNNLSPRLMQGWELKVFSTLHSDFKEVLYLDADNIPYKDPTYLFDDPRYRETGAIFWPDIPPGADRTEWLKPICWENCGMEYRDYVDFETGQYLINKEKCYKPLNITMWMNEHSDWFYKFVYGDKSTFHLAWHKCDQKYSISPNLPGWKWPCLLQHDLDSQLIFQHACQGKELMFEGKGPVTQFNHHLIVEAKSIRDKYWSGTIYSWNEMTGKEKKFANNYIGKYQYTRYIDDKTETRILELKDNGTIGEGSAKMERRWTVRLIDNVPTIVLIGAIHKESEVAILFAKEIKRERLFEGKWVAFEKCKISLERINID